MRGDLYELCRVLTCFPFILARSLLAWKENKRHFAASFRYMNFPRQFPQQFLSHNDFSYTHIVYITYTQKRKKTDTQIPYTFSRICEKWLYKMFASAVLHNFTRAHGKQSVLIARLPYFHWLSLASDFN